MVARAAEGAMRDAFSILDMCVSATSDGRLTAVTVRDVLGASDKDFLFAFADRLAACDTEGVMRRIDELMRSGREPQVFLKEVTRHLRALLTVKAVADNVTSLLDITEEDEKRYRAQADAFTQERLLRILESYMRTESELRYASAPRIGLEVASLKACEEARGENTAALLERIATLESKLTALTSSLDKGQYAVNAPPNAKPDVSAEPAQPRPAAAPKPKSAPDSEQAIWEQALQLIAKTEPPLLGLLKKERFIGARGTVYQLQVAFERKDFSFQQLNRPARRDSVSRALSEVAGKPLTFEAVLEGDGGVRKEAELREENARTLIDAFGRDAVQIDDAENKPAANPK